MKYKLLLLLTATFITANLFSSSNNFIEKPNKQIHVSVVDGHPSEFENGVYKIPKNREVTFWGGPNFENNGDIQYEWNFGDSNTCFPSRDNTATHTYDREGVYNVTLTTSDGGDYFDSHTFQVKVTSQVAPTDHISVDDSTYTVQELVEDILIDNECAEVTNITSSTGTNFTTPSGDPDVNGIGYFEANSSGFPISSGLLLSTGSAKAAEGPEDSVQKGGTLGWSGDTELENVIPNPNDDSFYNATSIEFDFVSYSNNFSFNFLFASEEYGSYQCDYADAFAFLFTDENEIMTNLAVVPGTNDPISL